MGEDEGAPQGEIRLVETIAFAREDGLPRRVSQSQSAGGPGGASMKFTTAFEGLKANPKHPEARFSTAAPDGYGKMEPPAQDSGAPALKVKVGDDAPAFDLSDLAGSKVSLASLKGKVVLLDFWATWCGPCKAAMPAIQKIHDDYKGKGVAVLGINTWENKEDAAKQYIGKKGFTYPCLLKGDDLAKAYGMTGIPTLVVIGKDGKIVDIEVGMAPDGDAGLRKAIDTALAAQ
jgi:thiol-disulfide isomerase/thioredoxin